MEERSSLQIENFHDLRKTHPSLIDHNYAIQMVSAEELALVRERENKLSNSNDGEENLATKKFSKCEKCRQSRTKVLAPKSLTDIKIGSNDGMTCDFCGNVSEDFQPITLPDVFEGRRGSKGGKNVVLKLDESIQEPLKSSTKTKKRNYVYCRECGKIVLKESLNKHMRDVHELSNKKQCQICNKILSGPFSLKEHINAVHHKQSKHKCPKCERTFSHFSNLSRHIKLVHQKMVVTHKYVNCKICSKIVQSTSLKKHMSAVHDQKKDYQCKYCNKKFALSYTLKEHTAAKHTFEFSHKCLVCNKKFAHKTNYSRHFKTVHKNEIA